MSSNVKQRVLIALSLTMFLLIGAVTAEAADTNGSDRLVKGAAIGAAVGAVTQMARGRTGGRELLKGAAVGGAVGAAVGAYSDYKQEKDARVEEERRADYYQSRAYNRNFRRAARGDVAFAQNGRAFAHNARAHRLGRPHRCR